MTDFRGMVGDPSDNLPGRPGDRREGRLAAAPEVRQPRRDPGPRRRSRRPSGARRSTTHADDARKTRDLAVIRTDAPVELDLDDVPPLDYGPERMEHLRATFERFEFGSLLRRLEELAERRRPRSRRPPPAAHTATRPWPATPEDLPHAPGGHRAGGPGVSAGGLGGRGRGRRGRRRRTWRDGTGAALAAALAGLAVAVPRRQVGRPRDRRGPAPGARHDDRRLPARPPAARRTRWTSCAPSAGFGAEGEQPRRPRRGARPRAGRPPAEEGLRRLGLAPLYRRDRAAAHAGAARRWRTPACAWTSTAWARSPPGCATRPTSCATRSGSWPAGSS